MIESGGRGDGDKEKRMKVGQTTGARWRRLRINLYTIKLLISISLKKWRCVNVTHTAV